MFELCQERFLSPRIAEKYAGHLVEWHSTVVLGFLVGKTCGVFKAVLTSMLAACWRQTFPCKQCLPSCRVTPSSENPHGATAGVSQGKPSLRRIKGRLHRSKSLDSIDFCELTVSRLIFFSFLEKKRFSFHFSPHKKCSRLILW